MRCTILLAIVAIAPLDNALTQQRMPQPGQRVRVTCPTAGLWQASAIFQRLERDSLVLMVRGPFIDSPAPGTVTDSARLMMLPASGVTRLEAYRGRGTRTDRILLMGAGGTALGAAVGWRIGKALDDQCTRGFCFEFGQAYGLGIGAMVGLLTGVVAGSLIKTDKWERVRLDALPLRVAPRRNGFGVGLRVAL